ATAPGDFTLHTAEPYCTNTMEPAVRLRWDASSDTEAYEVHRDGTLYAELTTLTSEFDNTSNLIAGEEYEYFIRSLNPVGTTDSNTRTVAVPISICNLPVEEAPLVGSVPGTFDL